MSLTSFSVEHVHVWSGDTSDRASNFGGGAGLDIFMTSHSPNVSLRLFSIVEGLSGTCYLR